MIGLKNSRHFLDQSEVKPKSIVTRSHKFSRASLWLLVFASCFDWFTGLPMPLVIVQSDYFGWFYGSRMETAVKAVYISHLVKLVPFAELHRLLPAVVALVKISCYAAELD